MAIRITCPGCKTPLTLDEDARGTKVRCEECDKVLTIPAAKTKRAETAAVQAGRSLKASPPPEDADEEEEERPAKKKKKKKAKKGAPVLLFVAIGAVLVVLLIGGAVTGYVLTRPVPQQQARAAEPKEKPAEIPQEKPGFRVIPRIEDGNPAKKGGTGVVSNVRGAGYRLERQSELKQIGMAFIQFCDEYKGAGRTYDNFMESIKTFGPIRDAVKDGYYKINVKARLDGGSIIAHERDKDFQGYLCVMGDGSVRYVAEPEWKAALGIK